jgi:hypothetical protein
MAGLSMTTSNALGSSPVAFPEPADGNVDSILKAVDGPYAFVQERGAERSSIIRFDYRTGESLVVFRGQEDNFIFHVEAKFGKLAVVESMQIAPPIGSDSKSIDTAYVMDSNGENRRTLTIATRISQISDTAGHSCGTEIISLTLLSNDRILTGFTQIGDRRTSDRCSKQPYWDAVADQRQRFNLQRISTREMLGNAHVRLPGNLESNGAEFAISPDGSLLANAERRRIRIVDLKKGSARFLNLPQHTMATKAVFGPNGSLFASIRRKRPRAAWTSEVKVFWGLHQRRPASRIVPDVAGTPGPVSCGRRVLLTTASSGSLLSVNSRGRHAWTVTKGSDDAVGTIACSSETVAVALLDGEPHIRISRLPNKP